MKVAKSNLLIILFSCFLLTGVPCLQAESNLDASQKNSEMHTAEIASEDALFVVVLKDPRSQRQKGWSGGVGYKQSKNYQHDPILKKLTRSMERDFQLDVQQEWPIESIEVHCLVVKIDGKKGIIERLENDKRVLWVQKHQMFEGASEQVRWNKNYEKTSKILNQIPNHLPIETPRPGENLEILKVPKLKAGITGKGIDIAIVDSGVDSLHNDLKHAIKSNQNYVDTNRGNINGEEHGTGMAGVIAGLPNTAVGFGGIAPEVNVHAYRACWEESKGARCSTLTLSRALDAIVKKSPDVLNLSLTGPKDFLLERLLDKISEQGTIIVTAYDRKRSADNRFPRKRSEVFVAKESNPTEVLEHDVFPLPGREILAPQPEQQHAYMSGDSLAAASLSAVIALMKQVTPSLSQQEIRQHLVNAIKQKKATSLNVCKVLESHGTEISCP